MRPVAVDRVAGPKVKGLRHPRHRLHHPTVIGGIFIGIFAVQDCAEGSSRRGPRRARGRQFNGPPGVIVQANARKSKAAVRGASGSMSRQVVGRDGIYAEACHTANRR